MILFTTRRTFIVITLNAWKVPKTQINMRVTIQMRGMGQEARNNITKKKKRIIANRILSITQMRHSFDINKCRRKRTKERNRPGKRLGRLWREKKRMRNKGARAARQRKNMMMKKR